MKAFVRWALLVAALTAVAVAVEPSRRGTSLRVGVFLVAVGGAMTLVARLRRALPDTLASIVETTPQPVVPPALPSGLRSLAVEVRSVDAVRRHAARTGRPARLPVGLRATLHDIAAARLTRHGLDLDDPADEAMVRAVLGPEVAAAVLDGQAVDPASLVAGLEAT